MAACTEIKPSDRPSARRVCLLPCRRQSDRCPSNEQSIETATGTVPLVRTFYRFSLCASSLARWMGPQRIFLPSQAFLQSAGFHVAPVVGSASPSVTPSTGRLPASQVAELLAGPEEALNCYRRGGGASATRGRDPQGSQVGAPDVATAGLSATGPQCCPPSPLPLFP